MNTCSYVECVSPSIENGNSDDARVLAGPAACKIYSGAKPPSPENTKRFMWQNQENQSSADESIDNISRGRKVLFYRDTRIMHVRRIELKELLYTERETSGGNAGSSLRSPSMKQDRNDNLRGSPFAYSDNYHVTRRWDCEWRPGADDRGGPCS